MIDGFGSLLNFSSRLRVTNNNAIFNHFNDQSSGRSYDDLVLCHVLIFGFSKSAGTRQRPVLTVGERPAADGLNPKSQV